MQNSSPVPIQEMFTEILLPDRRLTETSEGHIFPPPTEVYSGCEFMKYFWATYWLNLALAPIYALFVGLSIGLWARSAHYDHKSWRFRIATIGLLLGVVSSILLLAFYAHLWMTGTLIAHGSILWLIYYFGECSAFAGLLFALGGRGDFRFSAVIVNLVMLFQWYGRMSEGLLAEAMLSTVMYVCIAIIVCAWLFGRLRIGHRLQTDDQS